VIISHSDRLENLPETTCVLTLNFDEGTKFK